MTTTHDPVREALRRLESAVDWHLGRSGFTQSTQLKGVEHSANVRKELYAAHDAARAALAMIQAAPPEPSQSAKRLVQKLVNATCQQEMAPSEAHQNAYRAARNAVEAALAPSGVKVAEAVAWMAFEVIGRRPILEAFSTQERAEAFAETIKTPTEVHAVCIATPSPSPAAAQVQEAVDFDELARLGWQAIKCPACGCDGARGYPRSTPDADSTRAGGEVQSLAAWPIHGIRVYRGTVVIVAKGNVKSADEAARWMCGELLAMKEAK